MELNLDYTIKVKVKVPYPNWGVGGVLISLSVAIEPIGG